MSITENQTAQLRTDGYAILPDVFSPEETAGLLCTVESAEASSPNFRRSQDVFAIRNLLGELPQLWTQLLTPRLRAGLQWRERRELSVAHALACAVEDASILSSHSTS